MAVKVEAAAVPFSVIVRAYNEEALLPDCLHSLLQQSFPPHELIFINNASTDRTAAVASIPGVRVYAPDRTVARRGTGSDVTGMICFLSPA